MLFKFFSAFFAFMMLASLEAQYVDHGHNYSIEFPKGWTIDDRDGEKNEWVTAQAPAEKSDDTYQESIQITYNLKESATDLNAYLPEIVRFMKEKYNAAAIEEIGSTQLDGVETKWILFTAIGPGKQGEQIPLKALHYILMHDKHLIIILCVSTDKDFNRWRPTFEKSLQTLKFLNN